jgi:hypothetical protein
MKGPPAVLSCRGCRASCLLQCLLLPSALCLLFPRSRDEQFLSAAGLFFVLDALLLKPRVVYCARLVFLDVCVLRFRFLGRCLRSVDALTLLQCLSLCVCADLLGSLPVRSNHLQGLAKDACAAACKFRFVVCDLRCCQHGSTCACGP